jgi:hypothetical protein
MHNINCIALAKEYPLLTDDEIYLEVVCCSSHRRSGASGSFEFADTLVCTDCYAFSTAQRWRAQNDFRFTV